MFIKNRGPYGASRSRLLGTRRPAPLRAPSPAAAERRRPSDPAPPRSPDARVRIARSATESRRRAIQTILAQHRVGTQADLLRRLASRGIRASQATLSRDMAALRVRRAAGRGERYLPDRLAGQIPVASVRGLVDSVDSNGVLVVVRTQSSAAATVARALDEARLDEVMATLAGDDVVFVAPRRASAGKRVANRLRALLGLT
jgi:transcriptional regulator of arginine metabolism